MKLPAHIDTTWLPVALDRQVGKKPVKREVAGIPIVLWRGAEGLSAFRDRCPHRNYPLSQGRVEAGRLVCPYHGWAFRGDGACADIPGCAGAATRLKAETVGVCEAFGVVFVCLTGNMPFVVPPMPEGPDYDHFWWAMKPEAARVYDALDNVLDPFHTNFIHDGYIRVKHRRQRVEQTIDVFEDGFEATYVQDTDHGWMSRTLEGPRTRSRGRYFPPVAFQGRWEGPRGLTLCVTIWFVPENEGMIRPFARFSTPKSKGPAWLKEALIRLFLFRVIDQDADALRHLRDNIGRFGGPRFGAGPADRLSDKLMRLYLGQPLTPERLGPFEMWL
ncbi:Rieske 2Fe-2S domain-containing protein [Asticcacaulis sp. 201]|uniref:Rieske 2Fe-2S domain-containing protein n=1 Tax=Asticcacaulis sp. 201 TaxID=3028787 RepID=UPI0029162C52|nr:Rieske 2Fe-2S domain-containing protein [Asticcacaulis sp. 201]MDV6330626.1 Rieske 2Fe-2S domain-containing protein [Asticcacaulis sp. 201]